MLKTGSAIVSIYTEMTPNPETMKFVANKLLYPGKSIDFPDEASATPSPLAQELFGFPFVRGVFIASNFVTLTKMPDTLWEEVIPTIRQFLKAYLEEGKAVIHEDQVVLAFFVSLSFIIDGLSIIRVYARVFLGPHVKSVYEMAYRSS